LVAAVVIGRRSALPRGLVWSVAGLGAVLCIGVPYGIASKLISVLGLALFPIAAWGMARLADCREPVPALCAIAATVFLFDTNFTIYGGNIASTLAGEFAFSLSLCLSLLVIGYVTRGMDLGKWRASSAVLISLVALCHVIPLFFMVASLVTLTVLERNVNRLWIFAVGVPMTMIPLSLSDGNGPALVLVGLASLGVVLGALAVGSGAVRRRMSWLLAAGPVAAFLSAFWLVPFYAREPYFNDMGWERRSDIAAALLTTPMRWALPVALIGAVLAIATRDRIGMLFAVVAPVAASGVASLPDGKLWNARLLPFYYLAVYMLAAVGIALVARFCGAALSEQLDRPDARLVYGTPVLALAISLVGISLPLRVLPGGSLQDDGTYRWLGIVSNKTSLVSGWAKWNYSGYESKPSFREYREVVSAMAVVGEDRGCGRAMWEYHEELDRYGTPMALMLLPFFTDGCIGSMEGLYFESSATTPFHFLNQSLLSEAPSRAQRDLPYRAFDIDAGVAQLQLMGVRYYMAQSDLAIDAASNHADLVEVARSEPWVIYEVDASEMVSGLRFEPVVASGPAEETMGELASRFDVGWVSQAVASYNSPLSFAALPAEDGPADWLRVETLLATDGRLIEQAEVSNIEQGPASIRFTVDEPGRPVLVKTSFFPNWEASGADGPWRAGPNLMVVVPTSNEVKLSYGWTTVDVAAYVLSLAAVGALVVLARRPHRRADPTP
ncbi:MAG: 6-pyruvoyl-tetrahydropterin synthase-related protein, partial [Actinomycetota bacterium]|nr:6-pyruvoyl-tetrahydropterin synthase-related protein [Actinomycetota bacterium]